MEKELVERLRELAKSNVFSNYWRYCLLAAAEFLEEKKMEKELVERLRELAKSNVFSHYWRDCLIEAAELLEEKAEDEKNG